MINIENSWYRISIKALIFNKEWEILLCKENTWLWDFPWGWLDHWEEYDICLKRELKEETWLEVIEIGRMPMCFVAVHKANSTKRPWIANICFEVKLKNLDFTLSDECVEIWFYSYEDIKKL